MGEIRDGTPICCVNCGRKARWPLPEGWRRVWQEDGSGFNFIFCLECPTATATASWGLYKDG